VSVSVSVIMLLRAIHVLFDCIWVGVAVFNAVYLVPSIMATGPAGGQVMRVIAVERRLPMFMNWVMTLVLLSGLGLYAWTSSNFSLAWILSGPGLAFTCGALLAFATAGLAQAVTVPAVGKLGRIGAAVAASGGPPSADQLAEMGALQRQLLAAAQIGAAFVVASAVLMGVARYL